MPYDPRKVRHFTSDKRYEDNDSFHFEMNDLPDELHVMERFVEEVEEEEDGLYFSEREEDEFQEDDYFNQDD